MEKQKEQRKGKTHQLISKNGSNIWQAFFASR
jgi:hypothetical protein